MTPPAKSTLRLAIIGAAVAYLIGDLGVWHGPLRRAVERACAPREVVVARVFNHPLTRSQLERAVRERLWREGKAIETLTPESRQIARAAALDGLIDHELLRVKAQANATSLAVRAEEVTARLSRFVNRFDSPAAMVSAMKSQGLASERELRDLLAARLQQERYLESQIGRLVKPTAEEALHWYEQNRKYLVLPERVEVRQIFLPTLDHPTEEAQAKLAAARAELTAGHQDFASLAREISEDPATKDHGGALGWLTRDRLPADFTAPVFALAVHHPALIRTHLGWHLVEVTARQPAEERTFPQAQPEILAALEAVKRQQVITEFRQTLRRFEAANIEVYPDRLAE